MKTKFPYLVIAMGALVVLFFLLIGGMGLGKKSIQAIQISGAGFGVFIILMGYALLIGFQKGYLSSENFWSMLMEKVAKLPNVFWVALGILPAFMLFLVSPMFFNSEFRIHYPMDYLRVMNPIGHDLRVILNAVEVWFQHGRTTEIVLAPLTHIIFAPLLLLDIHNAYVLVSLITLASYVILIFLSLLISNSRNHTTITFIGVISIFSYGLQFELERGQYYTISLMLIMLAIYIFHLYPDFRWFGYILLSVAIQLKFFPAMFVVMFVDDWRDWRANLKRFIGLGLINFLLLFLFGSSYLFDFYNHMTRYTSSPEIWLGNHSINSFTYMLKRSDGLFTHETIKWIRAHSDLIENLLYLYYLTCFVLVMAKTWLKNIKGFNIDLLLICVIGSLVLPVSHDYTLPMLTLPFAMFISNWQWADYPWARIFTVLLMILASFTYALTLFPLTSKPLYLQNSLPMLFVILTIVTVLNIAQKRKA